MECPVCLEEYNSEANQPRVFTCGHGICGECLKLLVDTSKSKFRVAKIKIECPQCKRAYEYMTDKEANDGVGKNFALIAFIESSGLKL